MYPTIALSLSAILTLIAITSIKSYDVWNVPEPEATFHILGIRNDTINEISSTVEIPSSIEKNPPSKQLESTIPSPLHMVYIGNSIIFVNDCPDLLEKMILASTQSNSRKSNIVLEQSTCLQGGATFMSLWGEWNQRCPLLRPYVMDAVENEEIGSVDDDQFQQPRAILQGSHDWDYVVMNDQTQYPARIWSRSISVTTIRKKYAPLFLLNKNPNRRTVPVIIQTAAYRVEGIMGTEFLGTFDNFTDAVREGVQAYVNAFNEVLLNSTGTATTRFHQGYSNDYGARIAPVGDAYRLLRNTNIELYNKLYANDDYHPSPHGTWLQACVVFITCFGIKPPAYNIQWMGGTRSWTAPTVDEANTLLQTACDVTGLAC